MTFFLLLLLVKKGWVCHVSTPLYTRDDDIHNPHALSFPLKSVVAAGGLGGKERAPRFNTPPFFTIYFTIY
jgi:hypothetical protein